MRRPRGGGWICVPPPSPVLNPAEREKEAMTVAGLATSTLGVAIATTRRRRHPSMMEAIILVIVAAIVTACNPWGMTIIIRGGGEDGAMSHMSHAACDLFDVAVVVEIAFDKCDIAAMSQRSQRCRRDNRSDVGFVAWGWRES